MSKYVAQIEIATPGKIWNRCVFTDTDVNVDDLNFYYSELLGYNNVKISVSIEEVPESFNTSLIAIGNAAPSAFPVNDLETNPGQDEHREKYCNYIRQLCEMERTRATIQAFTKIAPTPVQQHQLPAMRDTDKYYYRTSAGKNKKAWVTELLNSLNPEMEYEDNINADATTVIPQIIGWIFTPSVVDIRQSRGSRIVLNKDIGEKWERLLGSDLYPDMVCCRRVSTHGWGYQHEQSNILVKSILEWYISSQDATISDNGVSSFIPKCETEIGSIVSSFKRIKATERLFDTTADAGSQIFKLLSAIEERLLTVDADPIDVDTFTKYTNYTFRTSGIPRELYSQDGRITPIIERWARSNLGFRANVEPLVSSWAAMWNVFMRGQPVTCARVKMFLTTIDCWDPLISSTFTIQEKSIVVQEWIWAYIDTQLVLKPKGKIKSVILHDQIRKWCYQYLPKQTFLTQISPGRIGPIFTLRGFPSKKGKDGRYTHGVAFKHYIDDGEESGVTAADMEEGIVEMDDDDSYPISTINNVQYSETTQKDGEKTAKRRTVTQQVVAEGDNGGRIEHFFTAVSHEVHLGTI
jgi:hypothetical protein